METLVGGHCQEYIFRKALVGGLCEPDVWLGVLSDLSHSQRPAGNVMVEAPPRVIC